MKNDLAVYQVQPAPDQLAGWLRNLLAPTVAACRIQNPPPIELRPTGKWAGWADSLELAPDGRVAISSRVSFYRKENQLKVILHEWSHRFTPASGHDAIFFATQMVLFLRADAAGLTIHPLALKADLYDIQDFPGELAHEPDGGLGRSITWAMLTARELADTNRSAEDAAKEIEVRYERWVKTLAAEPAQRQAAAARVQRLQAELVAALAAKRELSRWLVAAACTTLIVVFMCLKLSIGN